MPRNEDGEFELILGNRQLLSVFFIVVILLGVFFTMGYIVGRNSSPLAADAHRDKPVVVDATRPNPAGSVIPPADTPAQTPTQTAAEPPAATPAATPPVVEEPKPAPQKAAEKPEKAAKAEKAAEKPAERPKPASPTPDQPARGETYLQVAAVAKPEAQLFVDVLAKKGFHAIYASVPEKPTTFRVLVGPLRDAAAVAASRGDLEKAGFQGTKAIIRKF